MVSVMVAMVTIVVAMVTIVVAMEMEQVAMEFMADNLIRRPNLLVKDYNFTKNNLTVQ